MITAQTKYHADLQENGKSTLNSFWMDQSSKVINTFLERRISEQRSLQQRTELTAILAKKLFDD